MSIAVPYIKNLAPEERHKGGSVSLLTELGARDAVPGRGFRAAFLRSKDLTSLG
ncbi:MAG: hypothetical protein ABI882_18105 [Acidobacteriota bacterium]